MGTIVNTLPVRGVLTRELPPDEQMKLFQRLAGDSAERLPAISRELRAILEAHAGEKPEVAAPKVREEMQRSAQALLALEDQLQRSLDMVPDDPRDQIDVLQKKLDLSRKQLAEAQEKFYQLDLEHQQAQRTIGDRDTLIQKLQLQLAGLQQDNEKLQARLAELEQRAAIDPAGLGAALGEAVDAIQKGLTELKNPHVDYGLQEFDLQTQVNLQVNTKGELLIRFPGVNEQVPAQNLSHLQMRLRPIPKAQKAEPPAPPAPPAPPPK